METKANHILIGIFVLAMTAIGAGFLYWMAGWGAGTKGKHYTILFDGDVSGLTTASSVLFNGLKVGSVRSLELYKKDARKVKVLITVDPATPVRENSRAKITTQALTGFAAIQLTAGTPEAELLVSKAAPPYPVIKADPRISASLTQAVPETLSHANALLTRLTDLVAHNEESVAKSVRNIETMTSDVRGIIQDNRASIDATIKNIEAVSRMLQKNSGNIETIIENTKQLSMRFNTIADKLEKAVDGFNLYMSSDGSSLIGQAKEAILYFRNLAKKLDQSLGQGAGEVMALAKRSLREVEPFIRDAKRAFQSIERLMSELERNPQSLIYGKNGNQSTYASGQ